MVGAYIPIAWILANRRVLMSPQVTTFIQAVPTPLASRLSGRENSSQLAAARKVNDAQNEKKGAAENVTKAASERDQANQRLQEARAEEQQASRNVQAALLEKQQVSQETRQNAPGELVNVVV